MTANNHQLLQSLSLVQERTKKLSEVSGFIRFFFVEDNQLIIDPSLYMHAKMGTSIHSAAEALSFAQQILFTIPENDWNIDTIKSTCIAQIQSHGYKNGFILYPLRVALSGEEFSPGTFELLEFFGKTRSLARLEHAKQHLLKEFEKRVQKQMQSKK